MERGWNEKRYRVQVSHAKDTQINAYVNKQMQPTLKRRSYLLIRFPFRFPAFGATCEVTLPRNVDKMYLIQRDRIVTSRITNMPSAFNTKRHYSMTRIALSRIRSRMSPNLAFSFIQRRSDNDQATIKLRKTMSSPRSTASRSTKRRFEAGRLKQSACRFTRFEAVRSTGVDVGALPGPPGHRRVTVLTSGWRWWKRRDAKRRPPRRPRWDEAAVSARPASSRDATLVIDARPRPRCCCHRSSSSPSPSSTAIGEERPEEASSPTPSSATRAALPDAPPDALGGVRLGLHQG